jgi:hypothetical protein
MNTYTAVYSDQTVLAIQISPARPGSTDNRAQRAAELAILRRYRWQPEDPATVAAIFSGRHIPIEV